MTEQRENKKYDSGLDQRYIPRWQVSNKVLCKMQGDSQIHEGKTQDLSCTGACITIDQSILHTQKLQLTIYLSNEQFVELEGNIVWIKSDKDKKKLGIHFNDVSANAADSILDHAFEINPDNLSNHWFKGWN